MGCDVKRQGQSDSVRNRKRFLNEALPALAISAQQLRASADPAVPMQALAEGCPLGWESAGRPIRRWAKDPSIARRINDALQPGPRA